MIAASTAVVFDQQDAVAQCPSCTYPSSSSPWPTSWIPYRYSSGALVQDASDESPSDIDIRYDSLHAPASAAVSSDGTTLFFRMVLESLPLQSGAYTQYAWLVQIHNAQGQHVVTTGVDGLNERVYIMAPNGDSTRTVYSWLKQDSTKGTRITAIPNTTFYHLDFQIPLCFITQVSCYYTTGAGTITASSPIYLNFGTSASNPVINKDFAAVSGAGSLVITTLMMSSFSNIETGTLPVELTHFSGQWRNGCVTLRWQTATESNNHGFEVQRAMETHRVVGGSGTEKGPDTVWTTIGFVAGHGTTSCAHQYGYTDLLQDIVGGSDHVQYRLRQIDRDGHTQYSNVIAIARGRGEAAGFALEAPHPHPVRDVSRSVLTLAEASAVRVELCTGDGRVLRTLVQDRILEAGSHVLPIPRQQLVAGTYFLVAHAGGRHLVRPLVVLD